MAVPLSLGSFECRWNLIPAPGGCRRLHFCSAFSKAIRSSKKWWRPWRNNGSFGESTRVAFFPPKIYMYFPRTRSIISRESKFFVWKWNPTYISSFRSGSRRLASFTIDSRQLTTRAAEASFCTAKNLPAQGYIRVYVHADNQHLVRRSIECAGKELSCPIKLCLMAKPTAALGSCPSNRGGLRPDQGQQPGPSILRTSCLSYIIVYTSSIYLQLMRFECRCVPARIFIMPVHYGFLFCFHDGSWTIEAGGFLKKIPNH